MATHSSILAWRIPWIEEPEGATVHGVAEESDTTGHVCTYNSQNEELLKLLVRGLLERETLTGIAGK